LGQRLRLQREQKKRNYAWRGICSGKRWGLNETVFALGGLWETGDLCHSPIRREKQKKRMKKRGTALRESCNGARKRSKAG